MKWLSVILAMSLQFQIAQGYLGLYTYRWPKTDYKTMVEINDLSKQTTYTVEEFHANAEDRDWDKEPTGAMMLRGPKFHKHYVYRTKSGETATVDLESTNTMCNSSTLGTRVPGIPAKFQWHWKSNIAKTTMVGPTNLINYLASTYSKWQWKWTNTTIHRGIPVRLYTYSGINLLKIYLKIKQNNWRTPHIKKGRSFPVQLILNGILPADNEWILSPTSINAVYNFFLVDDALQLADRKFLQIPEGRGCKGMANPQPSDVTRGFHVAGEVMIKSGYHQDTIAKGGGQLLLTSFRLVYDFEYNTYSMFQDLYTALPNKTIVSHGYSITVTEENTGYSYTTNDINYKCVVQKKGLFGLFISLPNGETLQFLDPQELFNFTGYTYLGLTKARGLFARVFEKTVKSFAGLSEFPIGPPGAILTYYELDSSIFQRAEFSTPRQTPVKLEIRVLDGPYSSKAKVRQLITINFKQFDKMMSSAYALQREMSIRNCVPKTADRQWFQVTYHGAVSDTMQRYGSNILPELFMRSVYSIIYISPLRILYPRVTFQNSTFKITALLLDRPSAILDFSLQSYNQTYKNAVTFAKLYLVLSEEDCAKKCHQTSDRTSGTCKSYVWCQFTCYMNFQKTEPAMVKAAYYPSCVYRKRINPDGKDEMLFSSQALAGLEAGVFLKTVFYDPSHASLNITYGSHKYYAIDLTTNLARNKDSQLGKTTYNNSFVMVSWNHRMASKFESVVYDQAQFPLTFDSCAKNCENEPDFYCESFSFCAGTRTCVISKQFVSNLTDLKLSTSCDTFTRKYIEQYKAYKGIVLATKGRQYKAAVANVCAKLCSQKKGGTNCESFDFCGEGASSYCVLHETHFLDVQDTSDISYSNMCSHYSRNFLFDYQNKGQYQLSAKYVSVLYTSESVQNCSRLCSHNKQCSGFDFCTGDFSSKSECHLTTKTIKTNGLLGKSPVCKFYTKMYDSRGNYVGPKTSRLTSSSTKKGVSKGAAAGVGFLMIIIGLAIGAGVVFAVTRYRSKSGVY